MVNNVSSNRPDFRGETPSSQRVKPNQRPRNDDFRKTYKESPSTKEEEELAAIEENDLQTTSLFDLSKKTATKSKSSFTRSSHLKDSSDSLQNRPISSKSGPIDQEESDVLTQDGTETTLNDVPQKPIDEELFAANDDMPVADGTQQEFETSFPKTDVQPQKMPGEIKDPQHQAAQLNDAINRQQQALRHSQKSNKLEDSSFETKESRQVSKKDKSKEEARSQTTSQDKLDVGAVNSSIQSVAFQTEKAEESQDVTRASTIKDLANQIIDRIQVMRREDQMSTMVTLRHPPILEGATITLTTSDHAKREFNISFANLSPDAKLFLDRKLTEDSLTQTLERKGIVVHMLTTTTQTDNLINVDTSQAFRDRQEQQQQQQQQQQRRQQFQDEEETT